MSNKKLTILGIMAVVAATLAMVQSRISRQAASVNFGSSPLVAGLNIESVAAIQVAGQTGQSVKLTRQGDHFAVADKDNYPADVSKINTLISDCLDIRVTEKITSNPANHADLKVSEETAEYVITFLDADAKPIVSVILSPTDPESNTAHGRLATSDDVYAIQTPRRFAASAMDFVNADLLTVPNPQIESVAVKTPEGSYVLSATESGTDVTLEKMPDGKQFKGADYKTVFGAFSSVRFDDVQSEQTIPADLKFEYSYTCRLKDLKVYKLELAKTEDAVYAKAAATYLDATPVTKTQGEMESDEELKKKEDKLLAIDEVKEFTAQHKGWVYKIPSSKADNLTKPLTDLIEDIPAPEPTEIEENTSAEPTM